VFFASIVYDTQPNRIFRSGLRSCTRQGPRVQGLTPCWTVKSDVIPEIVRSEPHNCPICSMLVAVELRTRATETEWK
jgi:hypothetical protein